MNWEENLVEKRTKMDYEDYNQMLCDIMIQRMMDVDYWGYNLIPYGKSTMDALTIIGGEDGE